MESREKEVKNIFEISKIIISGLSANYITSLKIVLHVLVCYFFRMSAIPVKLRLVLCGRPHDLKVRTLSDYFTIYEIFIVKQYAAPYAGKDIIFDIGSHIGLSAIFFENSYNPSKIYCFEPLPENISLFRQNTGKYYDNIRFFPLALYSHDGEVPLYYDRKRSNAGSVFRKGKRDSILVRCRKVDSIIESEKISRIDIFKFDIEGAEFELFGNFAGKDIVSVFIGEIHAGKESGFEADEFKKHFKNHSCSLKSMGGGKYLFFAERKGLK
ncbi:MAG: FkbM family methyltransferase [Candidatus Aureabacteria bacterium]|nr:FkbM family methyltransferase [Candidatus Auribacterota bacterium]